MSDSGSSASPTNVPAAASSSPAAAAAAAVGLPPSTPVFNTAAGDDSSDGSDADRGFDMLDEVPRSIHAHCVGSNSDASRIYVGHDCGLTVWSVQTPLTTDADGSAASNALVVSSSSAGDVFAAPKRKAPPRCVTVTLKRMFGKQWADLGGRGYVFCAAVLRRTDYAVCGARGAVAGGAETEELFVLQGRAVRHRLFSRLQNNVAELARTEEKKASSTIAPAPTAETAAGSSSGATAQPTSPPQPPQQQQSARVLALLNAPLTLREVHIEQDRIFVLCSNSFHVLDLAGRTLFCCACDAVAPPSQGGVFKETVGKAISAVTSTVSTIGGWLFGSSPSSAAAPPAATSAGAATAAVRDTQQRAGVPPRYKHPMQCSVLSVLRQSVSGHGDGDASSQPVHPIVAAAVPGTLPGTFTVVDWSSVRPICTPLAVDVAAHTGHLAALSIAAASTAGAARLLAVTASTTGTTCRVFDALSGVKLRTFRMTSPAPDGSCLPTFRLRGVEVDEFGRVVVLCVDAAGTGSGIGAAASPAGLPPPPGSSSKPSGGLDALFFDAEDASTDGLLAPLAAQHLATGASFKARAVTAGVTMAAGKRAADAADAIRPMCRVQLPLRPLSPQAAPTANPTGAMSAASVASSAPDELCAMLPLSNYTGACSRSHSPDAMTVAVIRVHGSGVRSVAQVLFGALPRERREAAAAAAATDGASTSGPLGASSGSDSLGRMGAEVREARAAAGTSKIEVVRQF